MKFLRNALFLFTLWPLAITIFHAKHISSGSQAIKVKVYSPFHQRSHSTVSRIHGYRPNRHQSWGSLFIYLWFLTLGLGIPITALFSCNDKWINTHLRITRLTWKIPTTSCHSISNQAHKTGVYLRFLFRDGTCKFTWNGKVIPHIGRYGGLIWNNWGFRILDAQAEFPLSTGEG